MPVQARGSLTEALALDEQSGRLEAMHVFSTLGTTLDLLGLADEAVRAQERALHLARGVDLSSLPGALNDMAHVRIRHGRFEDADRLLDEAETVAAQHGWVYHIDLVQLNRLELALARGVLEEADRLARDLHARREDLEAGVYGALELLMAQLARRTGRPQQALALLERAIADMAGADAERTLLARLEHGMVLVQLNRADELDLDDIDVWMREQRIGARSSVARARAALDALLNP